MAAAPTEEPVIVGRILGPWGIKGWLQIYSYTDPREGIFDYSPWRIEGIDGPVELIDHKVSGKRLVIKLSGVDDPDTAQQWAHRHIAIERAQLPAAAEGEFYWHDLVGCAVINREGVRLGEVQQMLSTGAHDVMELTRPSGHSALLIPFVVGEYIDQVDLAAGEITVNWPCEWLEE